MKFVTAQSVSVWSHLSTIMLSNVYCRPGAPGPINVVVGGGMVVSGGGSHLQRLSPLRSDTEFSR